VIIPFQPLKTKKMKTKMTIANLKKMAVTVCSALVLTTGSFTQPLTAHSQELNSMARLEAFMNAAEHSVKFVAPAADETDEIVPAMERLEMIAGSTEASLQYTAPDADDNEEVNSAAERLESLISATEASVKYAAPAEEENDKVASAMERLELMADATEKTIMFKTPGIEETLENECNSNAIGNLFADRTSALNQ
jgi:hypothetical protein